MENLPGPWKENKSFEDLHDESKSLNGGGRESGMPIGCVWKVAIVFFLFVLLAKCNGI